MTLEASRTSTVLAGAGSSGLTGGMPGAGCRPQGCRGCVGSGCAAAPPRGFAVTGCGYRDGVDRALHELWGAWPVVLAVAGWVYGRVARRVEHTRFTMTLRRHGYASHGQYVGGELWAARRRAFVAGRGWCWCCGRRRRRGFPVHHLDYSRAGAGREADRDLRLVCPRCHARFHRWDRGVLRGLGVTLRGSTWLVWGVCWPVRVLRGR